MGYGLVFIYRVEVEVVLLPGYISRPGLEVSSKLLGNEY
jgi:hypothetical protein